MLQIITYHSNLQHPPLCQPLSQHPQGPHAGPLVTSSGASSQVRVEGKLAKYSEY